MQLIKYFKKIVAISFLLVQEFSICMHLDRLVCRSWLQKKGVFLVICFRIQAKRHRIFLCEEMSLMVVSMRPLTM